METGSHASPPPPNASPCSTSTPTAPNDPASPAVSTPPSPSFNDALSSPSSTPFLPPIRPAPPHSPCLLAHHTASTCSTTCPSPLPSPDADAAAIAARPKSLAGKGLRAVDRRPPGPAFVRHIQTLPRRSATLLFRL
ncbi:hypothetical protein JCM11251_007762 [Rhodosporidiobolus azoricus]